MKPSWRSLRAFLGAILMVAGLVALFGIQMAEAQRRPRPAQNAPVPEAPERPPEQSGRVTQAQQPPPQPVPAAPVPQESVQADVSSRSVAVTSSFTGTEIVVFGAVDNSRQSTAESGMYDVVIVLEGTPTRLVARRKSNVAGIWINTQSITFESVPSYYAILSTRPLEEVTNPLVLRENEVGFEHVRMAPVQGWETGVTTADLQEFREAVVRLKIEDGLYVQEEYGVVFIGRSLFRASVNLPANVPVGPLDVRVYLFREGKILSTYTARVRLEREGLELLLHNFAYNRPLWYGIFTVTMAVGAGLLASAVFKRGTA